MCSNASCLQEPIQLMLFSTSQCDLLSYECFMNIVTADAISTILLPYEFVVFLLILNVSVCMCVCEI